LTKRVRLADFVRFDGTLPANAKEFIEKPGASMDYQVEIPGYKGGQLTLVTHKPDPA
jgi:hypothetical protein